MTRDELPDRVRRAADRLRSAEPPIDLMTTVMAEAVNTTQERRSPIGWIPFGWMPVAATVVMAAVFVVVATFAIDRTPDVGQSPSAGASAEGSAAATPIHVHAAPIEELPLAGSVENEIDVPDGAYPASTDDKGIWLASEAIGEVLLVDDARGVVAGTVRVNEPSVTPYDLWPITDGTSVWTAGSDDRALVRIDAAAMRIVDRWPIDAIPYRIAPVSDAVWITDFDGGRVLKVRPDDGHVISTTPLEAATGIAVTDEAIWVATYIGQLARIDPDSGRVTATFAIATDATDVHAVGGEIWITGINGRRLERFDPALGQIAAWMDGASAVAFLDGRPWATVEGGIVLLDPMTLERLGAVRLPETTTDQLVAANGLLWAYGETPNGTVLYAVRPDAR